MGTQLDLEARAEKHADGLIAQRGARASVVIDLRGLSTQEASRRVTTAMVDLLARIRDLTTIEISEVRRAAEPSDYDRAARSGERVGGAAT